MKFNNLGFWDIALTKWSVFLMVLFLVSVWPDFANWVISTHWSWFLVPSLIFAIKPIISFLKKE